VCLCVREKSEIVINKTEVALNDLKYIYNRNGAMVKKLSKPVTIWFS